ncbi:uroporphyrinogen-III synthase [Stenotrophomonas sp. SY1]|uniref:uroporphyrinogen-III synthase n=1 Tax=Stenotrophomonas sp. SY1 TaxID=477235 RepID=UPI001E3F3EA6|nr:uroporphyrinogen-III synthase [Stenotrophomonas sp. SY1]MCD9088578.1 uroporphyrinogen-III synthase [Stenotrophomonas sp. SY1]
MNRRAYVPADTAWHLISLRPQGQHDTLRSAAARLGARTVALSPWRLVLHNDRATREQLADAAHCDRLIFTSPTAADAAARLLPLRDLRPGSVLAVGEGTARVLRQHGAPDVQAPTRMDSEGLLALPALQALSGQRVALITAPGGRGMIAAQVRERGATLVRVNVYERVPLPISAATLSRLLALQGPTVLAVSSGEALESLLPQLPAALLARWRLAPVVTASARLAELAGEHGFTHVCVADGPLPAQLASAARAAIYPPET